MKSEVVIIKSMSLTKYETSHSKGSVPIPVLAQE